MDIELERRGRIMQLRFNRPARKNALTGAMYAAAADALAAADADPAVRAVLLVGTDGVFTAGNDLEDFVKTPPIGLDAPVFRFLFGLCEFSKPLIAAVEGPAVGIGTTMLLHCDLVYAADTARFAVPFTQLGLVPEAGSSLLLPRLSGYLRAAEKLLLGETFRAAEALAMGLVTEVLPAAELQARVDERLTRLLALPASSLRLTKQLMKQGDAAAVRQRIVDEAAVFGQRLQGPEAREAFTAFLGKRKPDFAQFD